jgi:hypothetical protein
MKRHAGKAANPVAQNPSAVEISPDDLDKVSGGDTKSAGATTTSSESPKEEITFEYGGLLIQYSQQKPD